MHRLAELGLGTKQLATAVRAGELLKIADGIYLAPGADDTATQRLRALPNPFTLSQARQALDTTRRVTVPLMEHLAHCGITRRNAKDTGMRNLPFHDPAQNRIWLGITTLAADLLAWTQRLALTGPAASYEPKRLRLRILAVAGRLVRNARRTLLKIPQTSAANCIRGKLVTV